MVNTPKPKLIVEGKRRLRYRFAIKYEWRFVASNGRVLATDGRQDYENEGDARDMAVRILDGTFKDQYSIVVRKPLP